MKNLVDKLYLLLPIVLWPMVFLVFRNIFVYAMFFATLILATFSLLRYRDLLKFTRGNKLPKILAAAAAAAAVLYLIFYFGYFATQLVGLSGSVADVYNMLYSLNSKLVLGVLLIFIGIFEEIYWRGGVQSFAEKKFKKMKGTAWIISALYYGGVHLFTLNPILAISALFVGLVTAFVANRYGLLASMLTHILWIEAVVVFLPICV